jgi:nucleolar complex protein 2
MAKQKKRAKKFASKIKEVIKKRRHFQKIKERILKKRTRNEEKNTNEEPPRKITESSVSDNQQLDKSPEKPQTNKNPENLDQFFEDGFFKDLDEVSSSSMEDYEDDTASVDDDDENGVDNALKSLESIESEPKSYPHSEFDSKSVSDSEDLVEKHKRELSQLAVTDPQFYEFLKKEKGGEELLRFGQDDDKNVQELKHEEGVEHKQKKSSERSISTDDSKGMPLNLKTLKKWEEIALKGKSIKTTKRLIGAFRSAARINDTEDEDNSICDENAADDEPNTPHKRRRTKEEIEQFNEKRLKSKYKILDGGVFNFIIVTCLKNLGHVFDLLINRDKSKERKKFYPKKYPRWKKISAMVKSYLTNLIHFMNQLTDPKMITFLLKQTENMLGYFGPFPKLAKKFLKKLLEWWGGAMETVRVLAFLNIRRLALDLPFPFIDTCLKGIYLTFVRNAKFTNPKTQPLITFMMNCVVEMYGLDFVCSYQHMFVYIRQLAILLRTAYNNKTKEHYETVYNWQYINSLRVWTRVLCAYPSQEALSLLIYPLVQVIQGVITLVPTPRYFPLRLQCIKMMNEIALHNTNVFVNSLPFALEILQAPEVLKKASTHGTLKPTSLTYTLKVANKLLGTKVYQVPYFSPSLLFPQTFLKQFSNLPRFYYVVYKDR